jgi:two-component system nitrate/nitrite response regulator NarL
MTDSAVASRGTAVRARRPRSSESDRRSCRKPRVAVVERHALVAEAIGLTLADSFEAIPVPLQPCTTTTAARDAVLRARANVAVLILSRGGAVDMLTLVEQLSALDISVLVTGDDLDLENAERYLCAGAAAFWHTGGVSDVVRAVTREAERRATRTPPAKARHARASPLSTRGDDDSRSRRDLASLTAAEAKILWALMRGRTADDIARDHVVSIATVRTQIRQVLGKLGAKSQLSAVALAWRVGWTPGGDLGLL